MILNQGEKCAACGRLLPVEDPNDAFTPDDEWKEDLRGFLCGEPYKVVCASVEARIAKAARTGR